tara:strand:+ start:443 stop:775 length:333 start_codon:yes stop_codon:yes gene_type:complete
MSVKSNLLKVSYFVAVTLIYGAIYYLLSRSEIDHFNGLNSNSTMIDCFYFSFTTFSTVGYGDISPKSTLAKCIVVTHQMIMMMDLISLINLDTVGLPNFSNNIIKNRYIS